MRELLTSEEAAQYLRLSGRKLDQLVAKRAVPCTIDGALAVSPRRPGSLGQCRAPPRKRTSAQGSGARDKAVDLLRQSRKRAPSGAPFPAFGRV